MKSETQSGREGSQSVIRRIRGIGKQNPEAAMAKVFTFLAVEPIPVPHTIRVNEGQYEGAPSPEERAFLLNTFEFEIRSLERMLGWDCSSWLK